MGKHNAPKDSGNTPKTTKVHTDGKHSDPRTAKDTGYVGKRRKN